MKNVKRFSPGGFLVAVIAGAIAIGANTCPAQQADTPALAPAEMMANQSHAKPGTFELHVQGADLRGILQLLSNQWRRNIVATKEVTGEVTADLYGVTFDEALEAVLNSTGYTYRRKGNFVYVYTPQQLKEILKAEMKQEVRVFHLAYLTATDAQALIAPALSSEGTIALTPEPETGIEASDSYSGGDAYAMNNILVVSDYEDNIKQIAEILDRLDIMPQQVLIEATILRATLTEDNALGVDFNALTGINFADLQSTTNGFSVTPAPDGVTYDGDRSFGVGTDFTSRVPTGGLSIGLITNHVSLFIRALESVTDTTVLANPKLLVVNKQRGEIMVGNRDGYLTTTITETVATETVEFLETGTRLIVRPFIGRNGYIRMEIHPEDSSGSVSTVGTAALPSETTTEVTSNVIVRDGHTIVIGGLFRELTTNGRSQVPILGNIPYLGAMFRNTSDDTRREEVIILITPHIMENEADEGTSEQMKDEAERFRLGQRKGLRWWGRSRLAQTHMRWARQELRKGRSDKALWNLDMALSMQPRMVDAIRMKEQLTEKAYWADESRVSATKYVIQQMIMQELGKPVERIIPIRKPRDADKVSPDVRKKFGITKRHEDPPTSRLDTMTSVSVESLAVAAEEPAAQTDAVVVEVKPTDKASSPTDSAVIEVDSDESE